MAEAPAPVQVSTVTDPAVSPQRTLDELLLPVLERAYGLALRLTRNPADAEDIVQDAALAAARGFATFRQGTNFKAWFFQILTNCFYTRHRRGRARADLSLEDVPDLYLFDRAEELGLHRSVPDPARELLRRIDREQIDEALQRLPAEFRTVSALYLIEDLSYAEIAEILKLPVGTVRSRLHRGRKLLQQHLWRIAVDAGLVADRPRAEDG